MRNSVKLALVVTFSVLIASIDCGVVSMIKVSITVRLAFCCVIFASLMMQSGVTATVLLSLQPHTYRYRALRFLFTMQFVRLCR